MEDDSKKSDEMSTENNKQKVSLKQVKNAINIRKKEILASNFVPEYNELRIMMSVPLCYEVELRDVYLAMNVNIEIRNASDDMGELWITTFENSHTNVPMTSSMLADCTAFATKFPRKCCYVDEIQVQRGDISIQTNLGIYLASKLLHPQEQANARGARAFIHMESTNRTISELDEYMQFWMKELPQVQVSIALKIVEDDKIYACSAIAIVYYRPKTGATTRRGPNFTRQKPVVEAIYDFGTTDLQATDATACQELFKQKFEARKVCRMAPNKDQSDVIYSDAEKDNAIIRISCKTIFSNVIDEALSKMLNIDSYDTNLEINLAGLIRGYVVGTRDYQKPQTDRPTASAKRKRTSTKKD